MSKIDQEALDAMVAILKLNNPPALGPFMGTTTGRLSSTTPSLSNGPSRSNPLLTRKCIPLREAQEVAEMMSFAVPVKLSLSTVLEDTDNFFGPLTSSRKVSLPCETFVLQIAARNAATGELDRLMNDALFKQAGIAVTDSDVSFFDSYILAIRNLKVEMFDDKSGCRNVCLRIGIFFRKTVKLRKPFKIRTDVFTPSFPAGSF